ncbi:MAG: hypothetical protein GEU82_04625 [Luteitalea sp.]|nr:hypothetical protein [Luteitalea sp.]
MYVKLGRWSIGFAVMVFGGAVSVVGAQTHDHKQMQMDMATTGWHVMQEGQLLGLLNHQGGPRGGDELKAPNWWMGMASRRVASSQLTLSGMFSLDAATVGRHGYGELFQVGEAVSGEPLVDRQHPHDLFMQVAAAWRVPIAPGTGLTIAGGPAGEPALGPVAFMHRASAVDNPLAPLGHHTFDSTHIAFGVVTVALDRGAWVLEGSLFNGREPDEHRWDFDFGRMDSVSGRVWFRPSERWELQASTGHLKDPEELHPGDVQRTTASLSWLAGNGVDFTAVAAGYGANATPEITRHAVFAEATRLVGANSWFGRIEAVQVESDLLLHATDAHNGERPAKSTVGAITAGLHRELFRWRGFEGGAGAMVTAYAVPAVLRPTHGSRPLSFQLFLRVRPPAGPMGRMLNMRMGQPMPDGSGI